MSLQNFIKRYRKFSQRPVRLPTLVGAVLGFAGALTLLSLLLFWGSDTHRYIVDVQRASNNQPDDPDFPLIIPPDLARPPTGPLTPEQLQQAEAAIQAAAEPLDLDADLPPLVFGLSFVADRAEADES